MKSFLTGLPRSRTAFFATLLTWTDSLFFHDPPCLNTEQLREFIDEKERHYGQLHLGISDASLLFHWRKLVEWYPDARWVYIHRDYDDVKKSCEAAFGPVPGLFEMHMEAENFIRHVNPMVIEFDEVDMEKCYDVANHLGVTIGLSHRVAMLCDMNIQIHPPVLKRRFEALKCQQLVDTKEAA